MFIYKDPQRVAGHSPDFELAPGGLLSLPAWGWLWACFLSSTSHVEASRLGQAGRTQPDLGCQQDTIRGPEQASLWPSLVPAMAGRLVTSGWGPPTGTDYKFCPNGKPSGPQGPLGSGSAQAGTLRNLPVSAPHQEAVRTGAWPHPFLPLPFMESHTPASIKRLITRPVTGKTRPLCYSAYHSLSCARGRNLKSIQYAEHSPTKSSQHPQEEDAGINTCILQMWTMKHREAKSLAQGHTVGEGRTGVHTSCLAFGPALTSLGLGFYFFKFKRLPLLPARQRQYNNKIWRIIVFWKAPKRDTTIVKTVAITVAHKDTDREQRWGPWLMFALWTFFDVMIWVPG